MQLHSVTPPTRDELRHTQRGTVVSNRYKNPLILAACLAIVAVLFTVDALTPTGATPAIGYCIVPLLTVQTGRRWFVLGMMVVCTALTWVVYFIEPLDVPAWISVLERSMVTSVLWFSFVLVRHRVRASEALARQAQDLEEANLELRQSNQELDAFASVAAHDIRGPLATTEMFATLLADRLAGRIDRDCMEWLSLIQSEVRRMHSIIESLLDYCRFNAHGERELECECGAILAGALDGLKADLVANGVEVTHDVLPRVTGDPIQLAVLFQNLIGNAIKYRSEAQPKIHISVVAEQDGWKFSVKDNGIGIAPADSDRIFGLFQRGQGSDTAKGAGIGLATCKRIVELHGGRMWVESAPGSGSTFYFTIVGRFGSSRVTSSTRKKTDQERRATA